MPTQKEFAREVEELSLTVTGYQTGKSGQNGLCDCIGLIMGAMTRLGRGSYPMHSTNYFARYQMDSLRPIDTKSLRTGQIVYKAKNDQSGLDDRYKPGGRYYTGDLLDYYHVGAITDTDPLEITHCTQDGSISGIKRDSNAKGWTHVGEIRGVDYAVGSIPENTEGGSKMSQKALVTAATGGTVRMRKLPTTDSETLKKVPVGSAVLVNESAEGWSQITHEGTTGYMMSQYLQIIPDGDPDGDTELDGLVTIALHQDTALALYRALMKVVDG